MDHQMNREETGTWDARGEHRASPECWKGIAPPPACAGSNSISESMEMLWGLSSLFCH